ncbi:hypothetical protein BP1026B_I0176 [Burkholderia pseudomallei 1026b]|uniref:Uncharacterized protein n=1 Tax=Burkholderia pseudomallei (strain 1026b) TaxID=884204 RepID=A0A0H3HFV0_BURP2|nr:hypothetical protein GBP346_A3821 [Burkholderia pseudomallei MSHR346]AFI64847.1 hypothetical protein BP1026B_I0176 [Burkholderia pseudomallei 1026b]EIF67719.1 hypothetical protein BP1026A_0045 [Burkholderia pseudomallei 1026a]
MKVPPSMLREMPENSATYFDPGLCGQQYGVQYRSWASPP